MGMKNNDNPERFRNRKEALLWLQSRGQISQGKFYTDCNAGHLTIYPDKSLSKFQVAEYAEKVFGFIRQKAPTKAPIKASKRILPPSAVLPDAGQWLTMDTATKEAEKMKNETGIEDVDVSLKFDTPQHSIDDQEPGRGTIRMTAALNLTFTGDMQRMVAELPDIAQERITGAITEAIDVLKRGL